MAPLGSQLKAADGHRLDAHVAFPDGPPKGHLVVLQEIFGVTDHIAEVVGRFADEGYSAIAPALFDRIRPGVNLPYTDPIPGRELVAQLKPEETMRDIAAAIAAGPQATPVAVVGFCWGGSLAWLAAAELQLDAAICYYGTRIAQQLDHQPHCPVLFHFGAQDTMIPPEDVAKIRAANPQSELHVYPDAGHGFNCDVRASYHAPSAQLARQRTLDFLQRQLGG